MKLQKCIKKSFTVIGKEGSTSDGEGFIRRLWDDANAHFDEIVQLVKKDGDGRPVGIWGAMSDFSHAFQPWENNFSQGLYLAGAECTDDAEAPPNWTRWVVPGYEYLCAENDSDEAFPDAIRYIKENGLSLAGAVHDFTCPKTQQGYIFLPIRKLEG